MMRPKAVGSAIQLVPRGFAAKSMTSHDTNGENRCFSRIPTIDFSSIRDSKDAIFLFRRMVSMPTQPPLSVYSKLFVILVKMEEYSVALSLFDEMRQLRLRVNEYTLNIMINCCCLSNRVDLGFAMLGSFFKQDLKPDVSTFTTLLKGLYRYGKVPEAHSLFIKVLTFRLCEPEEFMIRTVISGLCRAGHTRTAHDLLMVLGKNCYRVDVMSYNAVIDELRKDGMVGDVLQLVLEMTENGIYPNIATYNSITQGLCTLGRWNEVKYLLLVEMPNHKVHPDVATFNILVDGFSKVGKMKESEDLLELMVRLNVPPDIFTYNSLIRGYCKNGNVDEAWRLFHHEIPRIGIKHTTVSYSTTIHGFFLAGRFADGWKLFKDMEARELHPDLHTYNILLDGLCRNRQIDEAFSFLSKIEGKGIRSDIITYNILLKGLCRNHRIDEAFSFLSKIEGKGLRSDIITYNILLDGLCRNQQLDEALSFLSKIEGKDVKTSTVTYSILINGLCRVGKLDAARSLYNQLPSKGLLPNVEFYNRLTLQKRT